MKLQATIQEKEKRRVRQILAKVMPIPDESEDEKPESQ